MEGADSGLFQAQVCVLVRRAGSAGPMIWDSPSHLPQAAQLEAARPPRLRYLLVVSTRDPASQDETVLLGVDFPDSRWEQGEEGREVRK